MLRRLVPPLLLGLPLGALSVGLAACALEGAAGGSGGDGTGGGGWGATTGSGGDASVDVAPDGENPPGPFSYAELCGEGVCVPGDRAACLGGAGGGGGAGGDAPTEPLGCQLVSNGGLAQPICAPVGQSLLDGPCQSNADCAAGLGCVDASPEVGEGGSGPAPRIGLCRPYCCGDLEACPTSTFCAPEPFFEDTTVAIPVCRPVDPCALLVDSACADDEVCTVVRADGTTSCVPAGSGELCEPCPCAEGFVCSAGTGVCQQLCHTDGSGECGGGGTCQGGSNLPEGIGVCIGGDAACEG